MALVSTISGDQHVQGTLSAQYFTPPVSSINDAAIQGNAKLATTKLRHRRRHVFQEDSTVTAAAKEALLCGIGGAAAELVGVNIALHTLMSTGGGDDKTVTVDIKNQAGTSVLNAPITIDKTDAAMTLYPATINTPALVAGNMLYAAISVAGGTGTQGKGVYVEALVDEDAL